MAATSVIEPVRFVPAERDLARSEEEEKLLRHIREEKEQLWYEIQVSHRTVLIGVFGSYTVTNGAVECVYSTPGSS